MKRKNTPKVFPSAYKFVFVGVLVFIIGVGFYIIVGQLLRSSEYFKIKDVKVDQSLHFFNKRELNDFLGKNIFAIDLRQVQRKLAMKHSQVSQLKIMKRFPNQIVIEAKRRQPFAQIKIKRRFLSLDSNAFVLSLNSRADSELPLILGLQVTDKEITLGFPLTNKEARMAINILKVFDNNMALSAYQVSKINIENLSMVNLFLKNRLKVIIDTQEVEEKLRKLAFILSKGDVDYKKVRYIDLRFNEPILGKK